MTPPDSPGRMTVGSAEDTGGGVRSTTRDLRELELIDVDLFARAVGPVQDRGNAVIGQAITGAPALPGLAARILG